MNLSKKVSFKTKKILSLRPKMPYLGIFMPEFEKIIDIFEINTRKLFKMRSFMQKWKIVNLGPKLPNLSIFGLKFEKAFTIFEFSSLKFLKHEFLMKTVNVGIGSTFSKGPSPSPGLLYKAYLHKLQSKNEKNFLDLLS